jgi:hypothetical protein
VVSGGFAAEEEEEAAGAGCLASTLTSKPELAAAGAGLTTAAGAEPVPGTVGGGRSGADMDLGERAMSTVK